jgi:hypothetical protein
VQGRAPWSTLLARQVQTRCWLEGIDLQSRARTPGSGHVGGQGRAPRSMLLVRQVLVTGALWLLQSRPSANLVSAERCEETFFLVSMLCAVHSG